MSGFGEAVFKNDEVHGIWFERKIIEQEYEKYRNIISWVKTIKGLDKSTKKKLKRIRRKLKEIFESDVYVESRHMDFRRILPSFVD